MPPFRPLSLASPPALASLAAAQQLPKLAQVTFEVLEPEKRPVSAVADSYEVREPVRIEVASVPEIGHRILFDTGHGLEERLIREQFM